jgi:hypothetical protein
MSDHEQGLAPEAPETRSAPAESGTNAIVDCWFADYAIPNHYLAAKEVLKRRLRSTGAPALSCEVNDQARSTGASAPSCEMNPAQEEN